jgi:hypothetical protein
MFDGVQVTGIKWFSFQGRPVMMRLVPPAMDPLLGDAEVMENTAVDVAAVYSTWPFESVA